MRKDPRQTWRFQGGQGLKGVLALSTEDPRFNGPMRVLLVLAGILLAAFGLGLLALMSLGLRESLGTWGWGSTLTILSLLLVPLVIVSYFYFVRLPLGSCNRTSVRRKVPSGGN